MFIMRNLVAYQDNTIPLLILAPKCIDCNGVDISTRSNGTHLGGFKPTRLDRWNQQSSHQREESGSLALCVTCNHGAAGDLHYPVAQCYVCVGRCSVNPYRMLFVV